MARVSDIPAYRDQAVHAALFYLDLAQKGELRSKFVLDRVKLYGDAREASYDASYRVQQDIFETYAALEEDHYDHERYAYCQALNRPVHYLKDTCSKFGVVISHILGHADRWYTDGHAVTRLILRTLERSIEYDDQGRLNKSLGRLDNIACELAMYGAVCDNIGSCAADAIRKTLEVGRDRFAKHFFNSEACWEKLLVSPAMNSITIAHESVRSNPSLPIDSADMFRMKGGYFCNNVKGCIVYRVQNLTFLVFAKLGEGYIIDNTCITYLRESAVFWSNSCVYWANYRTIGAFGTDQGDVYAEFRRLVGYLGQIRPASDCAEVDQIARHAKVTMAILFDEYHSLQESYDVGTKERVAALHVEISSIPKLPISIYAILSTMDISDRAKLDMAYFFHGFPPCHADIRSIFEDVYSRLNNSNPVDPDTARSFMNYAKAFHFSVVAYKTKGNFAYETVPNYDPTVKTWWRDLINGRFTQPPDEEMGKCWIRDHFPKTNDIEDWFWDAGDVTHVIADPSLYSSASMFASIEKYLHNEFLYSMVHAPKLSMKYDPGTIAEWMNNNVCYADQVNAIAIKAENAKLPEKMRETYSGSDIIREATTIFDRLAIPINRLMPNVTLRKAPSSVNFGLDCITMDQAHHNVTITFSVDVSGWSTGANRRFMMDYMQYVALMSKVPSTFHISAIWDRIHLAVNKRGMNVCVPCKSGMFQGFTGSMDTCLHSVLVLFAVRRAKRDGLLLNEESARSSVLIDDGVISIKLSAINPDPEGAIKKLADHIINTYKCLGFIVDKVKTIYSTKSLIYLNRFFNSGSEVCQASKTFGKICHETQSRFKPAFERISSIFQSAKGAAAKGADPATCYKFAFFKALRYLLLYNKWTPRHRKSVLIGFFFAPTGLGGYQFPTLLQWATNEATDNLAAFIHLMKHNAKVATSDNFRENLYRCLSSILSREFEKPSIDTFLKNPVSVHTTYATPTGSTVHNLLYSFTRRHALSPYYREAAQCIKDQEFLDALDTVVKSCTWDASILTEFGACLPTSLYRAIYDKAYKGEVIAALAPYRLRKRLAQRTRIEVNRHIHNSLQILDEVNRSYSTEYLTETSHFNIAKKLRDSYFDYMGVSIVNHTLAYPGGSLTHVTASGIPVARVSFTHPVATTGDSGLSTWGSKRNSYGNFYDGRPKGSKYYGKRSKGAVLHDENSERTSSRLQSIITRFLALCVFVADKGGDANWLFQCVCAAWGIEGIEAPVTSRNVLNSDTSTKRLNSLFSSRNHVISIFPNCINCVGIDSTHIELTFDLYHIHMDAMSIINCLKTLNVFDFACHQTICEDLHYVWSPECFPITVDATFSVTDTTAFLSAIAKFPLCDSISRAFASGLAAEAAGSEARSMAIMEDVVGPARGKSAHIRPDIDIKSRGNDDFIFRYEEAEVAAATFRITTFKMMSGGDMDEGGRQLSIAAVRKRARVSSTGEIGPYLFAATILIPDFEIPDFGYALPWSKADELCDLAFRSAPDTYLYLCNRVKAAYGDSLCLKPHLIWHNYTSTMDDALHFKAKAGEGSKREFLAWLWWLKHGHVNNESVLEAMAREDYNNIARHHKFMQKRSEAEGKIGSSFLYEASVQSLEAYSPGDTILNMLTRNLLRIATLHYPNPQPVSVSGINNYSSCDEALIIREMSELLSAELTSQGLDYKTTRACIPEVYDYQVVIRSYSTIIDENITFHQCALAVEDEVISTATPMNLVTEQDRIFTPKEAIAVSVAEYCDIDYAAEVMQGNVPLSDVMNYPPAVADDHSVEILNEIYEAIRLKTTDTVDFQ